MVHEAVRLQATCGGSICDLCFVLSDFLKENLLSMNKNIQAGQQGHLQT